MKKNTLFLSFVLGCMTIFASAQSKEQLELMKNSKVITQIEIASKVVVPEPMRLYDYIDSFAESAAILVKSPLLELKDVAPYVRNGDIMVAWIIQSDKLYLKALMNLKLKAELFSALNTSMQQYGKTDEGLILASWYSGELECIRSPVSSLFGPVAKYITKLIVEKGVIVSQSKSSCYYGSMEFCQPNSSEVYPSRDWHTAPGYNFQCLAQHLNDNYRPSGDVGGFLWMLTTDRQGFSHLSPLFPLQPDHVQIEANRAVEKLIEKLPQYSFGFLITKDHELYSGRFIEAKYTKDGGWNLVEIRKPNLNSK